MTEGYSTIVRDGVVKEADGMKYAYLPAGTVQCHAANLHTLPDGSLACVWFGGTQEGMADISVWMSSLAPRASQWSEAEQLSHDDTRSEQNPILFTAPHGEVWLLYTSQHAGNQDTADVRRRISTDAGKSWGEPEILFPADSSGGVFVRQPPVVLASGRILVPIFRCIKTPGEKWVGDHDDSAVMISDDHGTTWTRVSVPDSVGCVHMNIVQLSSGLAAFYRSRWADSIYRSESHDDGTTWTAPVATELPNNNSSIQALTLADGRIGLVYNHSRAEAHTERRLSLYDEIDDEGLVDEPSAPSAVAVPVPDSVGRKAFWGTPRAPMTLAISADGGITWPERRNLDVGDGYCLSNNSRDQVNREFSYPSIHQSSDGQLDLAYTYFRQAIKVVHVPLSWVAAGDSETDSSAGDAETDSSAGAA